LGDEVIGFSNFHHEVVVGEHVLLDLLNWELDKHTSDLWHSLVSNEVLDEWEDGFTNSLLEIRVLFGDLSADLHSNLLVLSSNWVGWTSSWGSWLRHWCSHWGSWLWLHHTSRSRLWHWSSHWGSWSWHTASHVWHWLTICHTWHSIWSTLVHLASLLTIVSSWAVLVLTWSSVLWSSSHHVSFLIVEVGVHGLVLLHDVQQLLKNLSHVWVAGKIVKMESTGLLGLIFFKVSFVDGIFNLDLSLLLNLVVVDDQGLSFKSSVVKVGLGNSS
jgi:hypothetical protein